MITFALVRLANAEFEGEFEGGLKVDGRKFSAYHAVLRHPKGEKAFSATIYYDTDAGGRGRSSLQDYIVSGGGGAIPAGAVVYIGGNRLLRDARVVSVNPKLANELCNAAAPAGEPVAVVRLSADGVYEFTTAFGVPVHRGVKLELRGAEGVMFVVHGKTMARENRGRSSRLLAEIANVNTSAYSDHGKAMGGDLIIIGVDGRHCPQEVLVALSKAKASVAAAVAVARDVESAADVIVQLARMDEPVNWNVYTARLVDEVASSGSPSLIERCAERILPLARAGASQEDMMFSGMAVHDVAESATAPQKLPLLATGVPNLLLFSIYDAFAFDDGEDGWFNTRRALPGWIETPISEDGNVPLETIERIQRLIVTVVQIWCVQHERASTNAAVAKDAAVYAEDLLALRELGHACLLASDEIDDGDHDDEVSGLNEIAAACRIVYGQSSTALWGEFQVVTQNTVFDPLLTAIAAGRAPWIAPGGNYAQILDAARFNNPPLAAVLTRPLGPTTLHVFPMAHYRFVALVAMRIGNTEVAKLILIFYAASLRRDWAGYAGDDALRGAIRGEMRYANPVEEE